MLVVGKYINTQQWTRKVKMEVNTARKGGH